jgi:hypothetical protein
MMSTVVVFLETAIDFSVTAIADVGRFGNVNADVFDVLSTKQVTVLGNTVATKVLTTFDSADILRAAVFPMKAAVLGVVIHIGLMSQTVLFDFFRNGCWILRKKLRDFFEGKTFGEGSFNIFTIYLA